MYLPVLYSREFYVYEVYPHFTQPRRLLSAKFHRAPIGPWRAIFESDDSSLWNPEISRSLQAQQGLARLFSFPFRLTDRYREALEGISKLRFQGRLAPSVAFYGRGSHAGANFTASRPIRSLTPRLVIRFPEARGPEGGERRDEGRKREGTKKSPEEGARDKKCVGLVRTVS